MKPIYVRINGISLPNRTANLPYLLNLFIDEFIPLYDLGYLLVILRIIAFPPIFPIM